MARIMALDVGSKTIGVAYCDDRETVVLPGDTLWRNPGYRRDMAAIRVLIADRQIERVVVGIPYSDDGTMSSQTHAVERFIQALRRFVSVPVDTEDERLSTFEAEQMLSDTGRRRADFKQVVDSVAASVILQSYLDRRRTENGG